VTEDMLADLGVGGAEADQLRALLGEVAALAHEVPEPSDDVRTLLAGAIPLHRRRRTVFVAAAVGALALGGVSAAAAANRLPGPVQEVVADATGGVVPHPSKPASPPHDTPGHGFAKPKERKKHNSTAPGQIHKSAMPHKREVPPPEPAVPGPADPGSHGRAHQKSNINGADRLKTEPRKGRSD
jgi:hypothetical protein